MAEVTKPVSLNEVNRFLLRKQHLAADSRPDGAVQLARDIAGLHATGTIEPYLAAFARIPSFARDHLGVELFQKRTLARVRHVRGTMYILPTDTVPVAFCALHSKFEKLSVRYMESQGISADAYRDVSRRITETLQGRMLTAAEIRQEMDGDLNFSSVLNLMCDHGLLVRLEAAGGWRARNYRYALCEEWMPHIHLNACPEQEATARLIEWYLRAFAPSTEDDMAWWTGLPKTRVRRALDSLRGNISHIEIEGVGGDYLMLSDEIDRLRDANPAGEVTVNLLPNLDPYLMGYRERVRYLDEQHRQFVFDRSGNVTSTILIDGLISGVWDYSGAEVIKVLLFGKVDRNVSATASRKAREMGRFITDADVEVRQVSSMTPLWQRTAGGFMSPLREGK